MLTPVALLLLLLGLLSGLMVVLPPLGLWPDSRPQPGLGVWLMFPGFLVIGYGLLMMSASQRVVRQVSKPLAGMMLLMGLVAALGLFGRAAGVWPGSGSAAGLWMGLVMGLLVGPTVLLAYRAPEPPPG